VRGELPLETVFYCQPTTSSILNPSPETTSRQQ
jgi:hypothetical protein